MRRLIILIVLFLSISIVNGINLTNGLIWSSNMEDTSTPIDDLIGAYDLTFYGSPIMSGTYATLNGSTDWFARSTTPNGLRGAKNITAFARIKTTAFTDNMIILNYGTDGTCSGCEFSFRVQASTSVVLPYFRNCAGPTGTINVSTGDWVNVVVIYNHTDTTMYLLIDNIFDGSGSVCSSAIQNGRFHIGSMSPQYSSDDQEFNGSIANVHIWNTILNTSQLNYLNSIYNYPFENSTLNLNLYELNNYISNKTLQDINYSVTGDQDGNLSYTLIGAYNYTSTTQEVTGNWNETYKLQDDITSSLLIDGNYNITFSFDDGTTITNISETFIIDETAPKINLNTNKSFSFKINITNLHTLIEDNLNYSYVQYNGTNITDTYTFSSVGNKTLTYYAKDNGNYITQKTQTLLINPMQYFRFNDTIRNIYINDYNINGNLINTTTYNNTYYNLLGSTNFLFTKKYYPNTQINYSLSPTSIINVTHHISPINLYIEIFDVNTLNKVDNWTLEIYKDSNMLYNFSVVDNYSVYHNDSLNGSLKLIISANNYHSSDYYFTFSQSSSITENIYLVSTNNSKRIPVIVREYGSESPLENAYVSLYKEDGENLLLMSGDYTDSNGYVYFNTYYTDNYLYKIIVSLDGYVRSEFYADVVLQDSFVVYLIKNSTQLTYIFDGFSYKIDTSENSTDLIFDLTYFDETKQVNSVNFCVDYQIGSDCQTSNYQNNDYETMQIVISRDVYTNYSGVFLPFNISFTGYRDGEYFDFYDFLRLSTTPYNETLEYDVETTIMENSTTRMFIILGVLIIFLSGGYYIYNKRVEGSYLGGIIGLLFLMLLNILSPLVAVVGMILLGLLLLYILRGRV